VNARIIVLDVIVYGCSLRVINCYAPTENDTDAGKKAFYQALRKLFVNNTKTQKTICLGDFNATTSAAWYNSSLREKTVIENLEVNDNGQRFHFLLNTFCLTVLNTWFTHKKC
jgi:endonuclease/exonuclease/phosphatase family metal-dependent hydrolase